MNFGLNESDFKLVNELVFKPLKNNGCQVWVFGSRARGDFHKYSDLDIVFKSDSKMENNILTNIKDKLEESRLNIKIDIVNIDELAKSYIPKMLQERIEV
jgi:predicted nucleotidyltransferase